MTRTRTLALLIALAAIFATASLGLALDNPTIASPQSDHHECAAPYDTVLFHASNMRGGPFKDQEKTAATCRAVGKKRFALSAAGGSMSLVALAGIVVMRRRTSVPR